MAAPVSKRSAAVGPELELGEAGAEVDTLGGLVVTRVGRVPVRGELVPGTNDFEFEVLDADPRRVKKIRIYRSTRPRGRPREATAAAAGSAPAPEPRNVTPPRDGQS